MKFPKVACFKKILHQKDVYLFELLNMAFYV